MTSQKINSGTMTKIKKSPAFPNPIKYINIRKIISITSANTKVLDIIFSYKVFS